REGLHFDQTTETGVVFHMLTVLGRHGFIGATAVGDTREQARALLETAKSLFDREAAAARRHAELPPIAPR
ncbi:MAG: peptide ligase PGM1-related protein, partial [Actinomycetota bacterium]|nr:peptide ligase PGM1-related protein [Actinomycetota bacterium]